MTTAALLAAAALVVAAGLLRAAGASLVRTAAPTPSRTPPRVTSQGGPGGPAAPGPARRCSLPSAWRTPG